MAFCVCVYDTVYILYIIIYNLSYQYIINIQNRNIFCHINIISFNEVYVFLLKMYVICKLKMLLLQLLFFLPKMLTV